MALRKEEENQGYAQGWLKKIKISSLRYLVLKCLAEGENEADLEE